MGLFKKNEEEKEKENPSKSLGGGCAKWIHTEVKEKE